MEKFTRKYAEKKASDYSKGKSSASVFKEAHERDFTEGWMSCLEETNAPELLEALKELSEAVEFLTSVDTRTAVANKNARVLLNAINKATL